MVTAEFAAALPAALLILALALVAIRAGVDEVRCIDAARAGARAAARGDDDSAVRRLVERAAPAGSAVDLRRAAGDVVVTVTAPSIADVPVVGRLPAPTGRAVAALEDVASKGTEGPS